MLQLCPNTIVWLTHTEKTDLSQTFKSVAYVLQSYDRPIVVVKNCYISVMTLYIISVNLFLYTDLSQFMHSYSLYILLYNKLFYDVTNSKRFRQFSISVEYLLQQTVISCSQTSVFFTLGRDYKQKRKSGLATQDYIRKLTV